MVGPPELRDLATETPNPRSDDLDRLSGIDLARLVFEEDAAVAVACLRAADVVGRVIDAAADALAVGGRLIYAGAGTSGRLALLDAVELLPTFGLEPERVPVLLAGGRDAVFRAREGAEDEAIEGARAAAALHVGPLDLLVGVTASGRTPYTLGALGAARRRGARTAAIVCNRVAEDFPAEMIVVLETGPEVLTGSTRMKAGSATKMTLNAISLGAMTRLGKVFGNRMVDVRVGCQKLVARARGLVEEIGGVGGDRAAALLEDADGHAKTAIVMARRDVDADSARRLLEAASGRLRDVLDDAQ